MSYDVNKRPQTEEEFTQYFYALIQKQKGGRANDYQFVMSNLYPWKGQMLEIPANLPNEGQQLPPDAPFYGLTHQIGGDGFAKGRLWIPAANPDIGPNGGAWYTRYIQYIADLPGGVHGVDFYWTWNYQSGNVYVPLGGPDSGATVPPDVEDRLLALESAYVLLEQRVTALENKPATGVQFGDKIALRTNSGMIAGIKNGGPTQVDAPINLIGKHDINAWESFKLEKGQ